MQVFLERDEKRVLPVPYWTDEDPTRRFWNLKRAPALAEHITEFSGCPELREFVLRMNGHGSRFATLGCAQWTKAFEDRGALTHEAGIYVDLVFDRFETAAKRKNYLDFFARLRKRASRRPDTKGRSGLTIVRVQPQRVDFADLGRNTAWMMSTWVFGAGTSEDMAVSYRRRGLAEVGAVCDDISREIGVRLGEAGTPIPP